MHLHRLCSVITHMHGAVSCCSARYIGPATGRMPVSALHPKFTNTGDFLIFAEEQRIVVVECESGDRIQELPMAAPIKV